jgi:hypothetical protein
MDLLYLALVVAFFALSWAILRLCGWLQKGGSQ